MFGTDQPQSTDTLSNIENVEGSQYADAISGDIGDNRLSGLSGDDALNGGAGNDILDGGAGNDTLDGGTGDDSLSGGLGDDTFVFTTGDGNDTVQDFTAGPVSEDALDISGLGYLDLASVLADTVQYGADTVITPLPQGGDSITLVGVDKAALHQDDFIFA